MFLSKQFRVDVLHVHLFGQTQCHCVSNNVQFLSCLPNRKMTITDKHSVTFATFESFLEFAGYFHLEIS
jgi:hypothetical protein